MQLRWKTKQPTPECSLNEDIKLSAVENAKILNMDENVNTPCLKKRPTFGVL